MLTELLAEPALRDVRPVVVNYDTDAEFKSRFNTPNRATVLVFRDGREVGRATNVTDKDALRRLIAAKPGS